MYKPHKPYKRKIVDEIRKTWRTPYIGVQSGTYPIVRKKFLYPEVDHTDGIGTKGFYHWKAGTFAAAVTDALAMNLNDLAVVRAVPYKLSNHITVPCEDGRILKIIRALVQACVRHRIAIVGGENSFHDTADGLDISMTVSGFVKKPMPNRFQVGDALVGLKSSGLHANGFTLIRKLFGKKVRKEFTTPTAVYHSDILELLKRNHVHGMAHVTGGAFTKLKDVLGPHADALLLRTKKLEPHKIFYELYRKGVSNETMYSTFNCGIGFVLSVPEKEAEGVVACLRNADVIGRVMPGRGCVRIQSAFDGKLVKL